MEGGFVSQAMLQVPKLHEERPQFSYEHESRLDLAIDSDLFEAVDMLKAAHGTQDYDLLEKALGFRHVANGVWQDLELRPFVRPVSGTRYDPMHTMYVNGAFGNDL